MEELARREAPAVDIKEALIPVVQLHGQGVVLLAFVAQFVLYVLEVCLIFVFYLLD